MTDPTQPGDSLPYADIGSGDGGGGDGGGSEARGDAPSGTGGYLGWRTRLRPQPAFSGAIGAAGGLLVVIGVIALGADQSDITFGGGGGSGTPGAAFCALVVLVGMLAVFMGSEPVRAGAVSAVAVAVPAFWIFLLGVGATSDPTTSIEILTLVSWAALYAVPPTKGRTVFLALTLVLLWVFIVDQVQSNDASFNYESREASAAPVVDAGFDDDPAQNYGDDPALDDLYDDCESGDLVACDDLYFQAPLGSEYEDFGSTCGDTSDSSFGTCATGNSFDNNFPDGSGDGDEPPPPDVIDESPLPNVEDDIGSFLSTGSDPDHGPGVVSMVIGLVYLGAAFGLDRKKLGGAATPFLVTGMAALGIGSVAVVYDTPWVVGVLLVATGVLGIWIAAASRLPDSRRRGSAWLGLAIVVTGVLTFSTDLFQDSVTGFSLLTGAIGIAIIAGAALLVAQGIVRDPMTEEELEEFTETGDFTRVEPPAEPEPPHRPRLRRLHRPLRRLRRQPFDASLKVE